MAALTSPAADSGRDELVDLIQRFVESLAEVCERLPFHVHREKLRSITTLAALAIAIIFAWKLSRSPSNHQRRQRKQPGPLPARANASLHANMIVQSSEASTSSGDLGVQDVADEFIPPVKLTLGQLVRQRLCEGRKVTCRLLGVILEETSPEEIQKHATVRSSVLEVLLEIAKHCDLYLMERILDDESEERVLSTLKDAGVFTSGGLVTDKVLFCSTENGCSSFVRQLEPDWHIDSNPEIIFPLARFIKYELYISPSRPERTASNVFTSTSLEQFFGVSA
ncbi:peroxisome biogenesis protein 22-like [Phoenix dactylifera]|uniref:Peroxisome biogenesis protein 22-like n=1 Tax=Phoenix dactylifera TaxID=42345 RepID=A0A8B7CJI0_PHODC|nr:peroxisome biogenesis protein 22-like [Phoenix dactylifera]XP_008800491.1 peroxisome biogenesis protein 22-like [Phoenix dactylifera]XP_026663393.1 peroxisome biogenesis protein 22-like [Phoenix dactylifera]